jgi:hypothetical protein
VNFFGHAVLAAWRSASPAYVLGAMLPDFANMIGARAPTVLESVTEDGVRFHHQTDAVFHDAPTFRALQAEARKTLRDMGLGRASALAVGHIGVEILLDAALARDAAGVRAYLSALERARTNAGDVDWGDATFNERYAGLCTLLADRGVTPGSADPEAVAFRVERALSSRPRLRLEPGGAHIVFEWAGRARGPVADAAPALVGEVAAGLAERGQALEVPPAFS